MRILFITCICFFTALASQSWTSYQMGKKGAPKKLFVRGFDSNDNMWLGSIGNTIISFDGEHYSHHQIDTILPDLDSISNTFYMENDSTFWLEGFNNKHDLINFNINSKEMVSYNQETIPLGYDYIYSPAFSPDNRIWFRTSDSGILVFDNQNWQKFDTSNSTIPLNFHTYICFDSTGNTYVSSGTVSGSKGGVSKYNGTNWEHYDYNNSPIPKALVVDIVVDKENALWIASDSGLNCLKNNNWQTWVSADIGFENSPKYKSFYNLRVSPQNVVWVNSNKKHLYYKDNQWNILEEKFPEAPYDSQGVFPVSFDSSGNVWIRTFSNGIVKFDYETVSIYDSANTVIPTNYPERIYTSPSGKVWSGMSQYNHNSGKWSNPLVYDVTGLANDTVKATFLLPDNRPFFVTNYGVSIRDSLQRWTAFENELLDSFNVSNIKALISIKDTSYAFVENNSNSYLCAKFYNNQWEVIKSNISEPISINDVCVSRNSTIWLATSNGVWTFNNSSWNKLVTTNNTSSNILSISTYNNNPVIGNQDGAFILSNDTWIKYDTLSELLSTEYITTVEYDSLGNLWCASLRDGILYYNQKEWVNHSMSNSSLPSNTINSIKIDRLNKAWFVTDDKGLVSFDTQNLVVYDTTNSKINSNEVSSICFDKANTKWIGTNYFGVNSLIDSDTTNVVDYNKMDLNQQIVITQDHLVIKGLFTSGELSIFNTQGKLIHRGKLSSTEKTVTLPSHLSSGMYFVNLKNTHFNRTLKFTKF